MDTSTNSEALRSIAIRVELSSGNIEPLLHEIRHALELLLSAGTSTTIDLKSIPLAPGEEDRILQTLGRGEVNATLSTFGTSDLVETAFPGVWIVTHHDARGGVRARFIEVTRVPEILCAQPPDVTDGLARLTASLSANSLPAAGDR
ncbi:MAG TPA: hydrogenase expression/formation C-terminal domain-containing protein [Steroidobacteraceae bacterium]|nr:hydrogenase expression/formation C-terminal domain-containing protein [Steroidobacteraceae bacterium]